MIAVTGSNGKSTTAALIAHILEENGTPVQLAGNIGRGVLDIEPPVDGEVIVLELSSYQTELARALTPDVAVFTNLSPDHLDRHGGLGGYFAAKRRLFAEGGPDRAVIGVDEPEGAFLAGQMSEGPGDGRLIRVSAARKLTGAGWHVFARKGFLAEWRKGRQVASIDLRGIAGLPGMHNHQNACCAYAAVRALALPPRGIEKSLHSFKGLPHRSQVVAEIGGVRFVNDSKATNVDAAAKAAAFDKVRWICGGLQKEGGLGALTPALGAVVKAYAIGREAQEFALQLTDIETEICTTMQNAVARAGAEAQPGEVVLLAPAAAVSTSTTISRNAARTSSPRSRSCAPEARKPGGAPRAPGVTPCTPPVHARPAFSRCAGKARRGTGAAAFGGIGSARGPDPVQTRPDRQRGAGGGDQASAASSASAIACAVASKASRIEAWRFL